MKNNREYLINEQESANDMFFGADGFADDNNFYGNEYSSFYGNDYSADGSPAPAKTQSAVPYVFLIANSTAADVTSVTFLGANTNGLTGVTNFGNPAAITISCLNGSITYAQFLQSLNSASILVGEMQLQSSNTSQPTTPFSVTQTDLNGATSTLPYLPQLDPYQNQNGVIVFKQLIPINAWTKYTFTMLASANMYVRLYPAQTIDTSRALLDKAVSRQYNNPRISMPAIRQIGK